MRGRLTGPSRSGAPPRRRNTVPAYAFAALLTAGSAYAAYSLSYAPDPAVSQATAAAAAQTQFTPKIDPAGKWQYGEFREARIDFYRDSARFRSLVERQENANLLTSVERQQCTDAPERCVGLMLLRRYKQLTGEYQERLKNPAALIDELLTALDEHRSLAVVNLSGKDVPTRELDRAILIDRLKQVPFGDKETLDVCLQKASYRDTDLWSLTGVPFVIGNMLMTPYLDSLNFHGAPPSASGKINEDSLVFEKYLEHRKLYTAILSAQPPRVRSGPIRLVLSHPFPPSPRFSDQGAVQAYAISGYGLLQRDQAEVIVINADLAKELFPENVEVFSDTPTDLGDRAATVRASFNAVAGKLRQLDQAIAESIAQPR